MKYFAVVAFVAVSQSAYAQSEATKRCFAIEDSKGRLDCIYAELHEDDTAATSSDGDNPAAKQSKEITP